MGQSYQQITARLAIDGVQRVRTPKKCIECGDKVYLISKRYKDIVCFECSLAEKKIVRALVVASLLLLCGCQSPPRKANLEIHFAGQELKVSVMR